MSTTPVTTTQLISNSWLTGLTGTGSGDTYVLVPANSYHYKRLPKKGMRLWLLSRKGYVGGGRICSMVVRARSPRHARQLASHGNEFWRPDEMWLDPKRSSCKELRYDGDPGILFIDARIDT